MHAIQLPLWLIGYNPINWLVNYYYQTTSNIFCSYYLATLRVLQDDDCPLVIINTRGIPENICWELRKRTDHIKTINVCNLINNLIKFTYCPVNRLLLKYQDYLLGVFHCLCLSQRPHMKLSNLLLQNLVSPVTKEIMENIDY